VHVQKWTSSFTT